MANAEVPAGLAKLQSVWPIAVFVAAVEAIRVVLMGVAGVVYPDAQIAAINEAGGMPTEADALGRAGITLSLGIAAVVSMCVSLGFVALGLWSVRALRHPQRKKRLLRIVAVLYFTYVAFRAIFVFVPQGMGVFVDAAPTWVGLCNGLLSIAAGVMAAVVAFVVGGRDVFAWSETRQ